VNLICGINPVLEALQARVRSFERLLIVKGIRNRRINEAISRASRIGVPLRFEARETLDRLAGGLNHQGIIAVVSAMPTLGLEEVLAQARDPALLLVLDGVEDPRNLGAILRTAETAGADGVLVPERRSASLSETVARASAGALEHVRVGRVTNVASTLEELKRRGLWVVGFDAEAGERWDLIDYTRPVALVFGGEGRGIRRLVRERCDQLAALPLFGHVESLNVSVTVGVALYEAIRQRGVVPSHVRPIPPPSRANATEVVGPAGDDAEHDPGAALTRPQAAAPEVGEGEDGPHRVLLVDEPGPAWAALGPVEVVGPRHRRRHGPGRRRRRETPAASKSSANSAPAPGPAAAGKRSRRRRRPKAAAAAAAGDAGATPTPPSARPGRRRRRRRRS
jgi:23S rRNA (guanosine2251-2'-O)-methyltransferase